MAIGPGGKTIELLPTSNLFSNSDNKGKLFTGSSGLFGSASEKPLGTLTPVSLEQLQPRHQPTSSEDSPQLQTYSTAESLVCPIISSDKLFYKKPRIVAVSSVVLRSSLKRAARFSEFRDSRRASGKACSTGLWAVRMRNKSQARTMAPLKQKIMLTPRSQPASTTTFKQRCFSKRLQSNSDRAAKSCFRT